MLRLSGFAAAFIAGGEETRRCSVYTSCLDDVDDGDSFCVLTYIAMRVALK